MRRQIESRPEVRSEGSSMEGGLRAGRRVSRRLDVVEGSEPGSAGVLARGSALWPSLLKLLDIALKLVICCCFNGSESTRSVAAADRSTGRCATQRAPVLRGIGVMRGPCRPAAAGAACGLPRRPVGSRELGTVATVLQSNARVAGSPPILTQDHASPPAWVTTLVLDCSVR